MEELVKEWIEILATGGPYGFLVASWVYFIREQSRSRAEVERIREAYQGVIGEKDDAIEQKDAKIESIYKEQIQGLGGSVASMTEALTKVGAVTDGCSAAVEKNTQVLARVEARL